MREWRGNKKWSPQVGQHVITFTPVLSPRDHRLPYYEAMRVVRKLNPKREIYEYEVEVITGNLEGQRFCFDSTELWPLPDA